MRRLFVEFFVPFRCICAAGRPLTSTSWLARAIAIFASTFRRFVAAAGLASVTTVTCFCLPLACVTWAQQPGAEPQSATPITNTHGNLNALAERLVTDPGRERRLQIARSELQSGRTAAAIQTLAVLAAEASDAFILNSQQGTVGSLSDQRLQLLKTAPESFKRSWDQTLTPDADALLALAIRDCDTAALKRIADRFVLTQPGLRATSILMARWMEQGSVRQVELLLRDTRLIYADESRFANSLATLERRAESWLQRRQPPGDNPPRPAQMFPPQIASASMPWPKPLWSWKAPMADLNFSFLMMENSDQAGDGSSFNNFQNWKPVIRHDALILRTPAALVALDRLTGGVLWQLDTDTAASPRVAESESRQAFNPTGSQAAKANQQLGVSAKDINPDILARTAFGVVTTDDQYLYFIDGFPAQRPEQPNLNAILGPRNRGPFGQPGIQPPGVPRRGGINNMLPGLFPNQDQLDPDLVPDRLLSGTRLVALHLGGNSSAAKFAWAVGDPADFNYRLKYPQAETAFGLTSPPTPSRQPASTAKQPQNPFDGHQFLTPPINNGNALFIVSGTSQEFVLNCLDRSTGSLLWRQSLIYDDSIPIEFLSAPSTADTATTVLLHKDAVICSLPNGLVLSASQSTGKLMWASSYRDLSQPNSFVYAEVDMHGNSAVGSFSLASNGILVAISQSSSTITGINLDDGKILWQVPRQAYGAAINGNSRDLFAAGVTGDQVILIGEQHCRSLQLETGLQNWVVETSTSTGRPWCAGNMCLIPESGGGIARVDLQTGDIDRVVSQLLPPDAVAIVGAVSGDQELVFVNDKTSVVAFSRTDLLIERLAEVQTLQQDPQQRRLIHARALLLNGQPAQALRVLCGSVEQRSELAQHAESISFAADLILQLTAELLFESGDRVFASHGQSIDQRGSGKQRLPSNTHAQDESGKVFSLNELTPYLDILGTLPLPSAQASRYRILTAIAAPELTDWDAFAKQLVPIGRRSLVSVDGDWTANAELLIRAETGMPIQFNAVSLSNSAKPDRKMFADAMLFADRYGGASGLLKLSEQASARGDYAAAEMLVLRALHDLPDKDRELRPQLTAQLTALRIPFGNGDSNDRMTPFTPQSTIPALIGQTVITEQQVLRTPDSFCTQFDTFRSIVSAATNIQTQWMLQPMDEQSQSKTVSAYNLLDGSCTDRVTLSHDYSNAPSDSASEYSPSTVFLADRDNLAAISSVRPGHAELLWEVVSRDPSSATGRQITVGPASANFVIWRSASRLYCSHPLTGQQLWSRQCTQATNADRLFQTELLFGDDQMVVVMDPGQQSFRTYRTTDGRKGQPGFIPDARLDGCLTMGRKVLCSDSFGRIMLFDPLTGQNLLATEPAVFGVGSEPVFRRLSDSLAVTISMDQQIVIIDAKQNKVTAKIPIAGMVNTRFVFGLTAFARGGRIFVCVNDEHAMDQQYLATPRLGEPRFNYGTLFCIDPRSWEISWHRRVDPYVVPDVYGDSSPLMLMWSHVMPQAENFNRALRSQRSNRMLRVTVLDVATGAVVAERNNLPPAYPIRCTYDANSQQMTLFSQGSLITITHESTDNSADYILK